MTQRKRLPLPAFPTNQVGAKEGMTIRDYFAASSPISLADAERSLASEGHSEVSHARLYTRLARMRYAYADAMLEARES
jgi:hypothetical protein